MLDLQQGILEIFAESSSLGRREWYGEGYSFPDRPLGYVELPCVLCGLKSGQHALFGCRPALPVPPSPPSVGLQRWIARRRASRRVRP